ncbi:MAG: hypothetical protein P4L39_04935 [Humidesulfovibrio sp.]|nr:hypothetical protein [Humidesulfovibrio sp.]
MKRLCCLIVSGLLCLGLLGLGQATGTAWAQGGTVTKTSRHHPAKAKHPAKAPAKVKKARRVGQANYGATEQPKLTKEELLSPYSAPAEQQNASRWFFEPAPKTRPFATPPDDSTINLRLGQDKIVDPVTGQEIKTRTDLEGAKEDAKNLNLKGAMDKVGGKAEVQVEILKF